MTDAEHKVVSLLRRDTLIIAKRHSGLSRDYYALADTYRLALDERVPHVLKSTQHRKTVSSELQPLPQLELPADPFSYPLVDSHD